MNILLICACGSSTSILVEDMKNHLKENEKEWLIDALSMAESRNSLGKYDYVLVAPQIRYQKAMIEGMANPLNVKVFYIDSRDYGRCDGDKVLDIVRSAQ